MKRYFSRNEIFTNAKREKKLSYAFILSPNGNETKIKKKIVIKFVLLIYYSKEKIIFRKIV